jgi:hypothetical protein
LLDAEDGGADPLDELSTANAMVAQVGRVAAPARRLRVRGSARNRYGV